MASGEPNWSQLAAMGKLPASQRDKVPNLAERDEAEARIKDLEQKLEEAQTEIRALKAVESEIVSLPQEDEKDVLSGEFPVVCEVEGCGYKSTGRTEGVARNILRMHNRAHPEKVE
jgi:hypothetical protein